MTMLPEGTRYWAAYIGGALGIAIFVLLAMVVIASTRGNKNSAQKQRGWLILIEGADGRLSASKAQWAAWTALVAGSYVAIYVARALTHVPDPLSSSFPTNLLLAMGFSTATMATAKGITTTYIAGGRLPSKTAATPPSGGLLTDDDGITDLSKVQLLTWTAIAIAVYLFSVTRQLQSIIHSGMDLTIPDIDGALMVLMGLSQGGYIGKKLTSAKPVTLSALIPSTAKVTERVRIYGSNFGEASPDSSILINGADTQVAAADWTDSRITFAIPSTTPNGPWKTPQDVAVEIVVSGQHSQNTLTLTIA